ncbi:MAG: Formylglycine-generating enzyme, required for sulfatase activity, contains SUMF1/FGE domain [Candidatus Kentron sp. G]|nr:MAG: Formylglycine-generating enzyme, required for sulfatase activity, contains SUMF1/FGE domain [Candidatus Kentron sp. G]VFN03584.1 MAG: Formylglycine-generating enzyme, required for sulfatase activity, contains SUMF1/FGE domain [Candidatus Kentron sp. G]VFN04996.1 MAG: Formylglycine-generating enzyme, required for sulfatase activity, contains SUMF1/FGE domain [Candidatus Kentron sp. G]
MSHKGYPNLGAAVLETRYARSQPHLPTTWAALHRLKIDAPLSLIQGLRELLAGNPSEELSALRTVAGIQGLIHLRWPGPARTGLIALLLHGWPGGEDWRPPAGDLSSLEYEKPDGNRFWESGIPPAWASDWGRDQYGPWVTFELDGVVQPMRWCPPGRFIMGSPADEPGRWDDEGPQHEVILDEGFWLFATPVTQALWQTVIGYNPSEFKSPDRPVENVSWDDCQQFLARIEDRVPGLGLILPSEAQWEYACRGGTETALYNGPMEILGERNAPALDAIAWYGGNSGVEFELENGWDSSDWREKQYPFEKAGAHPVGQKAPNPWGLFDMLGNVDEWTQDAWRGDYRGAPTDGSPWEGSEAGAGRVYRGGSWFGVASLVRAAYRDGSGPSLRVVALGLRCARAAVGRGKPGAANPNEGVSKDDLVGVRGSGLAPTYHLIRALTEALAGPACDPEPPAPPMAFIQQAASAIDDRMLTLLAALGPKAVAADPGLVLRLRNEIPQLPRLTVPQRQLLGARIAPLAAGPAQGDGGAGFDRAGLTHHGRLTALALSQLVLPPALLAWRYLNGGLLYRARTGREPPQLRPTIIVLDTSPACWGVIESLTRPAAYALAESLARQKMPALFLTTSERHVHPLTSPVERLQLLSQRGRSPADVMAVMEKAGALLNKLTDGPLEPIVLLLTHCHWGTAWVEEFPGMAHLRALFVQYPDARRPGGKGVEVHPPWARHCERWESLRHTEIETVRGALGRLAG